MYGPSSMDFIYDVDRTSSAMRHGTSSLSRWFEMPDGSAKSRVFDDFGSSERHLPKEEIEEDKEEEEESSPLCFIN